MVKVKLALDKGQGNSREGGGIGRLESLVAAQRLQTYDMFNSAFRLGLFFSNPGETPVPLILNQQSQKSWLQAQILSCPSRQCCEGAPLPN